MAKILYVMPNSSSCSKQPSVIDELIHDVEQVEKKHLHNQQVFYRPSRFNTSKKDNVLCIDSKKK